MRTSLKDKSEELGESSPRLIGPEESIEAIYDVNRMSLAKAKRTTYEVSSVADPKPQRPTPSKVSTMSTDISLVPVATTTTLTTATTTTAGEQTPASAAASAAAVTISIITAAAHATTATITHDSNIRETILDAVPSAITITLAPTASNAILIPTCRRCNRTLLITHRPARSLVSPSH
ncbi:hypothetical protein SprV_0301322500 [Sparganum proliferum]